MDLDAERRDVWGRLVADSGPGIGEARDVIAGVVERAGRLSDATPAAFFAPRDADPPFEEMISGAERVLEDLCGRYDYRQLLFLSRLCSGVPLLREADADIPATRVRVQNADRWVLRCGDRGLKRDYMRIEAGSISIGRPPASIFRDIAKLHWLANFHQAMVVERMMFNFMRLVSHENALPGPQLRLRTGGRVGFVFGAAENRASGSLYAARYRSQNGDLAFWAMGDPAPNDEPFTLAYGYPPDITDRPYGGGALFVPVFLWLDALMEYGKRFRPIFEREDAVGMPPEHLRAISRGLARLVMDATEDPGLAPWVGLTGTLPVPRDALLGAPLKEAARGYLADADPDRAEDANLERSVERFIALASSSPDAVPGHGAGETTGARPSTAATAPERGRERNSASARTLGYPYMIHGGPDHDL